MFLSKSAIHGIRDYPIRSDIRNELKDPCWIQHRVLTFDWSPSGPGVKAGILLRVHNPEHDVHSSQTSLVDFVRGNLNYSIPEPGRHSSTWDIDLPDLDGTEPPNEARILVVQLDNARDWEFTAGESGVRAKEDVLSEDCSLYFVDTSGTITGPGGEAPPDCRMVFWSITGRPGGRTRGFNFYISLIDMASRKKMPSIFDPNVPNTGGAGIP